MVNYLPPRGIGTEHLFGIDMASEFYLVHHIFKPDRLKLGGNILMVILMKKKEKKELKDGLMLAL